MQPIRQIVLVGHCGYDAPAMAEEIQRQVPTVKVVMANSDTDLQANLTPESLLLVNRVLEEGFAADAGVDLISQVLQQPNPPRAMLVSDYADAQQKAVEKGALQGFGKSRLYHRNTGQMLRDLISQSAAQPADQSKA